LIHREQGRSGSLEEDDCYDHSYRKTNPGHVDVVRVEPSGLRPEPATPPADHHVTTKRLKEQFEERLAARRRRHG
jgi:hypothetical protein